MFDPKEFEEAFQAALPDHHRAVAAKAAFMGTESMALFGLPVFDSFCASWPRIKGFIQMAISILGWFQPGAAALAGAFVTAFESKILGLLCQNPTPPAA